MIAITYLNFPFDTVKTFIKNTMIDDLSSDVLLEILWHLDLKELRLAAGASKSIRSIALSLERCNREWRALHACDLQIEEWRSGHHYCRKVGRSKRSESMEFDGLMTVDIEGKWLAAGGQATRAHIWSLSDHLCSYVHDLQHDAAVSRVALRPGSGELLATASRDGALSIWTTSDCALQERWLAHEGDIFGLVWTDRETVLSGGVDRSLRRWSSRGGGGEQMEQQLNNKDSAAWKCMQSVENSSAGVALALDAKLNLVASPSKDYSIALRDATTLDCHRQLVGHTKSVMTVAAGSGVVASGGLGKDVRVWDASLGTCIAVLMQLSATCALAVHGGLLFVGACGATSVSVWHVSEGRTLARLNSPSGGSGRIRGGVCAIVTNGRQCVSGNIGVGVPSFWQVRSRGRT